jgi:ribonuclease HI
MALHATGDEYAAWKALTAFYSGEATDPAYATIQTESTRRPQEAHISNDDLATLLEKNLIRRWHPEDGDVVAYGRFFTVDEEHKQRRRLIMHPVAINDATECLCEKYAAVATWPAPKDLHARVRARAANTYDFKSFFHTFACTTTAALHFALKVGNDVYLPNVVPTGAREPPIFAQLLTNTIARVAAAAGGASISHEAWIDNVRFTGDHHALHAADTQFTGLCAWLEIELGERATNQTRYDFLGVRYDHADSTVGLTEKTRSKLRDAISTIAQQIQASYSSVASAAGITLFAATIAAPNTRSEHYLVFKYLRKVVSPAYKRRADLQLWPCLTVTAKGGLWIKWMHQLLDCEPRRITNDDGACPAVIYTDSSLTGWGAVCFAANETRVVAGRWTPEVVHWGINLLELKAVVLALQRLHAPPGPIVLKIDNTTALGRVTRGWADEQRANLLVHQLQKALVHKKWTLVSAEYVRSHANPADIFSRIFSRPGPVTVAEVAFRKACAKDGTGDGEDSPLVRMQKKDREKGDD